ncbi:hypothetical protein F6X37_09200 [Paraburkholderia sp. 31.1]|uniref:hypothetical protein n=1 Tax=Paraburkholderia sp. 31.1 TaxID=2615205 RepID=UPI0016561392|nr:hypothetical protein [Paraburkholderia sp. 31.1]MBC8721761.1 hypothetical protein [Paraburkholderia sp. 31.1]
MAIDFEVGTHRCCTLYTRQEYRGSALSNEARAGRQLITSAGSRELTRDARRLAGLVEFIRNTRSGAYANGAAPEQIARALQTAVERGDVIAVVSMPRTSRGGAAPIEQNIRPYYETVTPSQLFRRALPVVSAGRSFQRPVLPRLPAEDGLAIWFARPGDVLPDGTIAMPVSTPLGDAQAFEYSEAMSGVDAVELAGAEGTPRNNQAQNKQFKAVVKALRLNQDQARQLHDDISKQGFGYHEMLERGQDLFGGGDD